jgi:hypothetical protein
MIWSSATSPYGTRTIPTGGRGCPGYLFRRAGVVDGHHDRVRFCWELATEGAPVVAKGTDFATVAGARMTTVTGFIDQAPA